MPSIKPPRNGDVLLSFRTTQEERANSLIYVPEKKNAEFEYYNVEAVGEKVVDIKAGDVVICKWARMTEPFEWEGKKYAVTDQKEIMAVVETDE